MPKKGIHIIEDYNAKENIVVCACGFTGTDDEYHKHRYPKNSAGRKGTLDFLTDINKARSDYPKNGSITGAARSYGK